jgi:peptide/nickel transport system permease protein
LRDYLLRRTVQAIPVLWGITVITFALARAMPGDPFSSLLNPHITAFDLQNMRYQHGLLDPLPVQYYHWLVQLLHGDLGNSYVFTLPVVQVIGQRLPATLSLDLMAVVLSLLVTVPLGVMSAVRQYSLLDHALTLISFVGIAAPTFFVALLAVMEFSFHLTLFPPGGVVTPGVTFPFPQNELDVLHHLILPAMVLAFGQAAGYVRYLRSSMLEVIRQDFVRTARSKGLGERVVIYKHALRNAVIPLITLLGLSLPFLFSGGILTETVFTIPGIAYTLYSSVIARDYPVIMGITLMLAVLTVLGNLLADVAYALVDPRIRYS